MMKKGFGLGGVLIIVGIIVLVVVSYYYTENQKEAIDNNIEEISEGITYINEEYDFQLALTNAWLNYKTLPHIYKSLSGEDDVFGIDFCLPLSSDSSMITKIPGYECLFKISGISIEKSDKLQEKITLCEKEQENLNAVGRKCNNEIGRSDKYIFLSNVIVNDSSNEGSLALKDLTKIFESFKTF